MGSDRTRTPLWSAVCRRLGHGTELLRRAERAAAVPEGPPAGAPARNPKRLAREAARAARDPRPSTAAQEAVRLDLERRAQAARRERREDRAEQAEHRHAARRAKSRARHRGH